MDATLPKGSIRKGAIVGALAALSVAAISGILRMVSPVASDVQAQARGPAFEASGNSTIDATGAVIPESFPAQIGKATDNSLIAMPGLVITDNHDGTFSIGANPSVLKFPAPTGEFSTLTKAELEAREMKIASDLREFENRMMTENRSLPRRPQGGVPDDIFNTYLDKYVAEYQQKFMGPCLSLASEMLGRIVKEAPGAQFPSSPGARAVYYKVFPGGPHPGQDVAEFLDGLREHLPN